MRGIIEGIKVYSAKGEAGKELTEARMIEGMGLEGDFHAAGGERQLSLRFSGTSAPEGAAAEKGLCFSRFRENIAIRGIDPGTVRPGARFAAGEADFEITGETKHCHEECVLFQEGKPCSLAGLNLFAKVIKGGVIRVGDQINHLY